MEVATVHVVVESR